MIGPFVAAGVSAIDLIWGLLLGKPAGRVELTFLTAPIATRARLTLYYQLEKICGRSFVVLYNLVNGVAFCFLAGSMVTVSATALGYGWVSRCGPQRPLANSLAWVLAVFAMGGMIAVVAAAGYKFVARIANYAAPWMVLVFIAFGLVGLSDFMRESGNGIDSLSDVWTLAQAVIWTGGDPLRGEVKFTFWHVSSSLGSATWRCTSDVGPLGVPLCAQIVVRRGDSSGMYLGHFLAWISASILYSLQIHRDPRTPACCRPAGGTGLRARGRVLRNRGGLDDRQPTIYRAGWRSRQSSPACRASK
jgi:energy-converting hydrogenase Eha subunit C